MRFGNTDHINFGNFVVTQDAHQRTPLAVFALETGIGSGILAFFNLEINAQACNRIVQLGFVCARDAMLWPGVHEVGVVRKMLARVNMPILRGDNQIVFVAVLGDEIGNALGTGISALDSERAALAKTGLDVNDY